MINMLRSKKFYNLYFQQKKDKLDRYLLKYPNYKIGDDILCFEDRQLNFDIRFANNGKPEKQISFTVGKIYNILDKKNNKIKIKGDQDKLVWTTTERFLGNKVLRKIKLEKLEKNNNNINRFIE